MNINKNDEEFNRISKILRSMVPKIEKTLNFNRQQVILWYNINNIALKGKKPVDLVVNGKEKELIEFLNNYKKGNKK